MVSASSTIDNIDLGVLRTFIYQLNISRRQISAYPVGHPIIAQALTEAMTSLDQVLEFNSVFELGIAEDRLLLGQAILDENNPVFQDFAVRMFAHHIATISISVEVTRDQLQHFCQVLARDPDELVDVGGAAAILRNQGIEGIVLTPINYAAFSSCDLGAAGPLSAQVVKTNQSTLWQRFIGGMMDTSVNESDDDQLCIDPNWLAAALNEQIKLENEQEWKKSYDNSISSFVKGLATEDHLESAELQRFNTMIAGLNKPLRQQFLRSTFRASGSCPQLLGALTEQLSRADLLDIVGDGSKDTAQLPDNVLALLSSLSHAGDELSTSKVSGASRLDQAELHQRFSALLSQDSADHYVPDTYQHLMQHIIRTPLRESNAAYSTELEADLNAIQIEQKNLDIILMLLKLVEKPPYEVFRTNLIDLWDLALETGSFDAILLSLQQLAEISNGQQRIFCHSMLAGVAQPEFIDKLLDALAIWGKPSYTNIKKLLLQIGEPVIPRLLCRLADESSVSRRRYYIEVLSGFGLLCIAYLVELIDDRRWYFVRNLLVILRQINQPVSGATLAAIAALEKHQHSQVCQELLAFYLQLAPQQAEQFMLSLLADCNARHHCVALRMVGRGANDNIVTALIELFHAQPLLRENIEHKKAIICALVESANPLAQAELEAVLRGTSLRHPLLYKQLKSIVLKVLPLSNGQVDSAVACSVDNVPAKQSAGCRENS